MSTSFWRILLVDDDEDDYFLTRMMLSEARCGRFSLEWAPTFDIGRRKLQANVYDAVLVDYDLGPRNGLDLIRQAVAGQYKAPLILYTGRGSFEVDVEAMEAGATLYLSKSEATPLLLERIIRYAIEYKHSEEALRQARTELERRVYERTLSLRKTNELLENIFSNVHMLIAYMDCDFNFIRVNRRYADADGRDPDFFPGKNHFDLYPNEENEAIFRQVVKTGTPYSTIDKPFVYSEHPERGTTCWDWSLQPVKEPDGQVSGVVLSLIDTTERNRVFQDFQENKERMRAVVSSLPIVLWAVDRQGIITLAEGDPHFILGLLPENLVGRSVYELFENRPDLLNCIKQAFQGEEGVTVGQALGNVSEIMERVFPRRDDEGYIVGVIGVSTVITDRVRTESNLQASNTLLDGLFEAAPDACH